MTKLKGLRCPQCGKYLNFGGQVQEMDKDYGDDVEILDSWLINIFCKACNEVTVIVEIFAAGEAKKVYSPALDATVSIPHKAKKQN